MNHAISLDEMAESNTVRKLPTARAPSSCSTMHTIRVHVQGGFRSDDMQAQTELQADCAAVHVRRLMQCLYRRVQHGTVPLLDASQFDSKCGCEALSYQLMETATLTMHRPGMYPAEGRHPRAWKTWKRTTWKTNMKDMEISVSEIGRSIHYEAHSGRPYIGL